MIPVMVVGAIASGIASGVFASQQAKKQAKQRKKAYQQAAVMMKDATEKYSGTEADRQMRNAGEQEALRLHNLNANNNPLQSNLSIQNALNSVNDVSQNDTTQGGVNLGRANKGAEMAGKYNAVANQANLMLDAANIQNKIDAQSYQNLMGGLSGAASAFNKLGGTDAVKSAISSMSDERAKEKIPDADAEDALRQIESIEYEYKDPEKEGCDDETHVGITAQSLEGTAFGDAVKENEEGYKMVDKWRLLESVTAGIAALQKEIDELEGKNADRE